MQSEVNQEENLNLSLIHILVKPVNVNEMVLRVGALLRRAQILNEHKIVILSLIHIYNRSEDYQAYENLVKETIDYESLEVTHHDDMRQVDEIVNLIVETVMRCV